MIYFFTLCYLETKDLHFELEIKCFSFFKNLKIKLFGDEIFDSLDTCINGKLYKLLMNCLTTVFKEKLQLNAGDDYDIVKFKIEENEKKRDGFSNFNFHMKLLQEGDKSFPAYLIKLQTKEMKHFSEILTNNIEKKILEIFDLNVRIGFKDWTFEPIFIDGFCLLQQGKFTEDLISNILDVIMSESKDLFDCDKAEIKHCPKMKLSSKPGIHIVIDASSLYVRSKVDRHKNLIKNWFLDQVDARILKSKFRRRLLILIFSSKI